METYRIINPKKPHRKYFKTEEWIRKYAHTMRLHSLFFSDQKEISTDFNLFLKEKGILLQSVEKPVQQPTVKFEPRYAEEEKKERPPVDDEQPVTNYDEKELEKQKDNEPNMEGLEGLTVKQLRDYAKDNNISLGSLRKKSAIIEAIINN